MPHNGAKRHTGALRCSWWPRRSAMRSTHYLFSFLCIFAATALLGACAQKKPREAPPAAHSGTVEFPTSCEATVQADFNHAVTLLHHMTYPQARTLFRAIADRDPHCAMAQWGIAMTLFQPLWPTRPSAADLQLGWQTVEKAQAVESTTARERAYVHAAAEFFRDPDSTDYWQRIARWEAAMKSLHESFPDDSEASVFYALALVASAQPGPALQVRSQQAVDLLLPIYRRNPDHPGAMHYIIHANDIPGREHENLDIVHRYEEVAPDNPHALHMPTHIYTRLGDWEGVIRGNLRAADAALRYPTGAHGELVWDEFAHAIEYLVYAYLQEGADEQAAAQIRRLLETPNVEPTAKTAFHLASTRARYALERHAWAEAAALVPRDRGTIDWDRFPWPEAVSWFARGYGAVRSGKLDEARHAAERLQTLESHADVSGETVFARQIQMLRLELSGWNAHASHDDAAAISLLKQAVDLEGSTPKPAVTPAATLPAAEVLGDLLLELGHADEALVAYRQSLQRFPNRFNGTLGVARALAANRDAAGAHDAYCKLMLLGANGVRVTLLADVQNESSRQPCAAQQ
jgi:tetratricopeptide (TPR) repeat protein